MLRDCISCHLNGTSIQTCKESLLKIDLPSSTDIDNSFFGKVMIRTVKLFALGCTLSLCSIASTYHVGAGYQFPTLVEAVAIAQPGDTILVHTGTYNGGIRIANLQGTPARWISIIAAPNERVFFNGGMNAWQMSDVAYIFIKGFTFQQQTGNGLNIDDGGTYQTPTHHIVIDSCTFRDINATGNNDLLKMSGVDDFEIRNCRFFNGAPGGSGIDMVGCHNGLIVGCVFENQGMNSIQAKGGSRNIRIERNYFKNGGQRTLNLGGSTSLPYFRPIDAPYEASELKVYSNVFIGSQAPIAFVGCTYTEVINNTIYLPTRWVIRILQETVDTLRFAPCGYNSFRNNIIYRDNQVSTDCNIGPNTNPQSFTFSNNLWFHSQNASWSGPTLPVTPTDDIVGQNPLFIDATAENLDLLPGSPAIGRGYSVNYPLRDFNGRNFADPRSIGAFEGNRTTFADDDNNNIDQEIVVYPNPSNGFLYITNMGFPISNIRIYDYCGGSASVAMDTRHHSHVLDLRSLSTGIYYFYLESTTKSVVKTIILQGK